MKKRLISTIAALAMVISTYIPARAEFKGVLQRDLPWMVEVASGSPDPITVTVYYLGRDLELIDLWTVPGGATVQQNLLKPGRGVRRAVVDIDMSTTAQATVRITQGANQFGSTLGNSQEGHTFRLVFEVE